MVVTEIVDKLQDSLNAGDVDALLDLFAEDAAVTIPALSPRTGSDQIRALFDFCVGIKVRWDFKESRLTDFGVECAVDQFDGWANLMGVAPLQYEPFRITIADDRIKSIEGSWSETTLMTLGQAAEEFTPWALENHPELFDDDGDYRYSRQVGAGFIAAAEEWMSLSEGRRG